jgi:D-erythronate 2-dehydrogenase
MNIVITGGGGFLGRRLAQALLSAPDMPVERLVLADHAAGAGFADPRVIEATGDIADRDFVESIITPDVTTVFHLAAVVSGEAEADFDLGMRVNVDGSRLVLEASRALQTCPRVVFTSSVAVFGPLKPGAQIDDETSVDPRSSYGMEKAVAELLLKDYSRRGLVDGLVLRLPTISVRPGRPNRAASSFASGIIREPLSGLSAICPVPEATALWLLSPRRAIEALVTAATFDTGRLGANRVINLPGISVTVAEMLSALEAVGGSQARRLVTQELDAVVERIVASWPKAWDDRRARSLGFEGDPDFISIVEAFVADDLPLQRAELLRSAP